MHLTNVAVQKTADNYDARSGGKWDIRSLKLYMISQFGREMVDAMFWRIQMLVLRSLFAVQQVMINDKHCFELYGYDIMIDDTLKPWLIEVNASPSLTANTREDYEMKFRMLNDVFDVVDAEGKREGGEENVGGFDLIYDNGYVEIEAQDASWSSYLGSQIPDGINVAPSTSTTTAGKSIPSFHASLISNMTKNAQKSGSDKASDSTSLPSSEATRGRRKNSV